MKSTINKLVIVVRARSERRLSGDVATHPQELATALSTPLRRAFRDLLTIALDL